MYIIDRFEGESAVLETDSGNHISTDRKNLPSDAKEGDCLILQNGVYSIDNALTAKIRKEAFLLQEKLFKK